MLFVIQCSIQGHSQIYSVGDMLKLLVIVIPCNIQLPACFSVLEVESTCLCFFQDLHTSDSFHSIRPDSAVLQ